MKIWMEHFASIWWLWWKELMFRMASTEAHVPLIGTIENKNVFRINFDLQNKSCWIHCAERSLDATGLVTIAPRTHTYTQATFTHINTNHHIWRVKRKLALRFSCEKAICENGQIESHFHRIGWSLSFGRTQLPYSNQIGSLNCSNYNSLFKDASAYFP